MVLDFFLVGNNDSDLLKHPSLKNWKHLSTKKKGPSRGRELAITDTMCLQELLKYFYQREVLKYFYELIVKFNIAS